MNRVRKAYCAFTLQPHKHFRESKPWWVVISGPLCWVRVAALGLGLRHHSPPLEGKGNLVDVGTGGGKSLMLVKYQSLMKVHFKPQGSKKWQIFSRQQVPLMFPLVNKVKHPEL